MPARKWIVGKVCAELLRKERASAGDVVAVMRDFAEALPDAEIVAPSAPESLAFIVAGLFGVLDAEAWGELIATVLTDETCTEEVLIIAAGLLGPQGRGAWGEREKYKRNDTSGGGEDGDGAVERLDALMSAVCKRRSWKPDRFRGTAKVKASMLARKGRSMEATKLAPS